MKSQHITEIKSFFKQFGNALSAGDGKLISTMWVTPALVVDDNQTRAVSSKTEVEKFFSGAKEQYNARGITEAIPEVVNVSWPSENTAIAEVHWPYINQEGKNIGGETSTYTLHRGGKDDIKICAIIMHGPVEEM